MGDLDTETVSVRHLQGLMVLASRASGCLFGHPNPSKEPLRTPTSFGVEFQKNLNLKLVIEFFHLLMIPMTLYNDIMPYFDEFINLCL